MTYLLKPIACFGKEKRMFLVLFAFQMRLPWEGCGHENPPNDHILAFILGLLLGEWS